MSLHPAQNRGLRELYAMTRQLIRHWSALGPRFAGTDAIDVLEDGVERARALLADLAPLTEQRDLYGYPAAQGVGASIALTRLGVTDRFLERNQALRTAVIDVQHVVTLLAYQAELARTGEDENLAEMLRRHENQLLAVERAARRAATKLGRDPDYAIEPLDTGPVGRAAHGVQYAVGSVGEWFDRRRGKSG